MPEDIHDILNIAFNKAHRFMQTFQPFLEIFWKNSVFDPAIPKILESENLLDPVKSFEHVFE